MSKSNEQWEFLKDFASLILYAERLGYKLTAGELLRPDAMQEIYIKEGKTQVNRSNHQDKLAGDLNLFIEGKIQWNKNEHWEKLGDYWKSLNPKNRWGGDYKTIEDPYHFERIA